MKPKTIEEKEFVTIQYTIEKSRIQQRKLKNDILELSKELQHSKRTNGIMLGVLIVILIVGAIMMHFSNAERMSNSDYKSGKAYGAYKEAQKVDDSLRLAVKKLTKELSSYKTNSNTTLQAALFPMVLTEPRTNEKQSSLKEKKKEAKTNTSASFTNHACVVNKVFKVNATIFIEAQFIGTKEVPKSKESTNVQVLQLHKNVRIHKRNGTSIRLNTKIFDKIMEDKPILSVLIKDRVVYKITEEEML